MDGIAVRGQDTDSKCQGNRSLVGEDAFCSITRKMRDWWSWGKGKAEGSQGTFARMEET